MDEAITTAIETYQELNAAVVDELREEPSPLEFMRFVAKNRPFVVRNAASEWKAVKKWNADFLRQAMREDLVNVAVTPLGNADAIVEQRYEPLLFVEPHVKSEPFEDFLDYIQEDAKLSTKDRVHRPVKYAQTQNDNLRGEYESLFADTPKDIAFARIALKQEADAINMWIGNERSVTSLHKDNYENIYVQVCGQKHFVLLPPIEMPCANEKHVLKARYRPAGEDVDEDLVIQRSEDDLVPVPVWDPDDPQTRDTPYSHLSKPLRVTLAEGDMLYLPAMWYHKVKQSPGPEGFACAVNYWYDMDFSGPFWTGNSLLRDITDASRQSVRYPRLEPGDDQD